MKIILTRKDSFNLDKRMVERYGQRIRLINLKNANGEFHYGVLLGYSFKEKDYGWQKAQIQMIIKKI